MQPRSRARLLTLVVLVLLASAAPLRAADDERFSFVVLGHLRGDPLEGALPARLLDEVIASAARRRPQVAVLTGDVVYGFGMDQRPVHDQIVEEWEILDARLATLNAPILRTPGNHDIYDLTSRDVYVDRYEVPPLAATFGRCRFILLESTWVPDDGDTRKFQHVRGMDLGEEQIEFLRRELADDAGYDHAFIFMHHLLWWRPDGHWMREVHPLLAESKVRAVFGGDYGPAKYTHMERDGVQYVQTSIETEQELESLRQYYFRAMLGAQMDVYAHVVVEGDDVHIDIVPVGVTTTERYTPERWRTINKPPTWDKIRFGTFQGGKRRRTIAWIVFAGGFGAGAVLACGALYLLRRWRRRRSP